MAKRLKELAYSVAKEADELRGAIHYVRDGRTINIARGDQLEQVKKIVILEYEGDVDSTRERIYLEIELNESEGQFDAVAKAIEIIFKPYSYRAEELGDATLRIHISTDKRIYNTEIEALKQIIAGGVGSYITTSPITPFCFLGGNGAGFGVGKFSSIRSK